MLLGSILEDDDFQLICFDPEMSHRIGLVRSAVYRFRCREERKCHTNSKVAHDKLKRTSFNSGYWSERNVYQSHDKQNCQPIFLNLPAIIFENLLRANTRVRIR